MIFVMQSHQYAVNSGLMDQMFRLRKKVFHDELGWEVSLRGEWEYDEYDTLKPAYLLWTDSKREKLYAAIRLLPTTGPTLLYDVFRRTFPDHVNLAEPGIWEGTRMCIDEAAIAENLPDIGAGRAFCLMLLALCEVALEHGIHTLVSNYEPHLKRIYQMAGAELQEIGRADGYGKRPVCCGVFEVSERIRTAMRNKLGVSERLLGSREAERAGAHAPVMIIGIAA